MSINEAFEHFSKLKVLIIGDVMLDSYLWGKVERISPEAPVPIVNVHNRELRLGGAGNVALNIHSLGAQPILCSVIGNDVDGQNLLSLLESKGMSKEGLLKLENRPTTIKHRIISGSQHILRVDSETDKPISSEETEQLFSKIKQLLPDCHVVIFQDYDKGLITSALIEKTVLLADKQGVPTVVDPKKRNFLSYKNVTLFKPNLKELKEGLKIDFDKADKEEIKKASSLLMEKINAKATLITLSEHGVFVSDGKSESFSPAHARAISDVSGAGDTVVSVAALTLALGFPLKKVAELSNLAGGIVCEYIGVVPIERDKLLKEAQKLFP